jgi:hypothetical protein
MDTWPFEPLAISAAVDAKAGDLDPSLWEPLIRALRLVTAGETSPRRQQIGLWSSALPLLARARVLLPPRLIVHGADAAERSRPETSRPSDADDRFHTRRIRQRAQGVSDAVRGHSRPIAVELARVVDALAESLLAALGATASDAEIARG